MFATGDAESSKSSITDDRTSSKGWRAISLLQKKGCSFVLEQVQGWTYILTIVACLAKNRALSLVPEQSPCMGENSPRREWITPDRLGTKELDTSPYFGQLQIGCRDPDRSFCNFMENKTEKNERSRRCLKFIG